MISLAVNLWNFIPTTIQTVVTAVCEGVNYIVSKTVL